MTRHLPRESAVTSISASPASEAARLREGLRAMRRQIDGGVILQVVRPTEALRLESTARLGHCESRAVLDAIMPVVRRIYRRIDRTSASCAACERPIAIMRFSAVAIVPFLTWPRNALAVAVCQRCGTDTSTVRHSTVRACHAVWPEMMVIEQTHSDGGRA